MSTNTYFDREAALDRFRAFHTDRPHEVADNFLDDEGFCTCCHADWAGLDRDDVEPHGAPMDELNGEPLTSHTWPHNAGNQENRVDFDNDEGETVATVRMVRAGSGYAVIIDQLSDVYNLIVKHTND